jgi:hypothetical protein
LGRERIIERERRWARPTAFAAVGATALIVVGLIFRASVPTEDQTADQLQAFHDHAGALAVSSVLTGIGFLLWTIPLLYLFRAAQARNPRVQGALVAFCFIGPVLFGLQGVVNGLAISNVASDFVQRSDEEQSRPLSEFDRQVARDPESIEKVTFHTDSNTLEVEQADGSFYSTEFKPGAKDRLLRDVDAAKPGIDNEDDADGVPPDAFAEHLLDDSSAVTVGSSLLFPALLGMIIGMVYVSLQSLRTGLLTRFFGTLGMALGVSLILLPPAPALLALWFGYFGLLVVDRAPGGRPPAWEAGEAIPLPRPGEEPSPASEASGKTIEGEATEVPTAGEQPSQPPGGQPGSRKRKRKRRR